MILTLIILLSTSIVHSGPPEIIWERYLPTGFDCRFWGIDCTDDGGVVCVGESASCDEEGIGRDTRTYDHGGHETARILIELNEGGLFIGGSTMESGGYQADIWLVKTDLLWEEIWTLQIEGEHNDSAWDVVEPETGGFIVVGPYQS